MKKIVSGDRVKVISGASKGRIGVVQEVISGKSNRCFLLVSGVNIKKYVKRDSSGAKFESREFPIDVSNALPVSGEDGDHSRVGFKLCENVRRRYLKKTNVII